MIIIVDEIYVIFLVKTQKAKLKPQKNKYE